MSKSQTVVLAIGKAESFARLKVAAESLGFEARADESRLWFERYQGSRLCDTVVWDCWEDGGQTTLSVEWRPAPALSVPEDPLWRLLGFVESGRWHDQGKAPEIPIPPFPDPDLLLAHYPRGAAKPKRMRSLFPARKLSTTPTLNREEFRFVGDQEECAAQIRAFAQHIQYREMPAEPGVLRFWRGDPESVLGSLVGYFQCPSILEAKFTRSDQGNQLCLTSHSWWSNRIAGIDTRIAAQELQELRAYIRGNIRPTSNYANRGLPRIRGLDFSSPLQHCFLILGVVSAVSAVSRPIFILGSLTFVGIAMALGMSRGINGSAVSSLNPAQYMGKNIKPEPPPKWVNERLMS